MVSKAVKSKITTPYIEIAPQDGALFILEASGITSTSHTLHDISSQKTKLIKHEPLKFWENLGFGVERNPQWPQIQYK